MLQVSLHYHHLSCWHLSVLNGSSSGGTVTNTICLHKQVQGVQKVMVFNQCASVSSATWLLVEKRLYNFFFRGTATQSGSWPPHSWGFLDHTRRRTTVSRTPLDKWSARRRDLYLTTHNTHNRQTSMPPVGFEPTISAGERLQTYALDRAATGTCFI